MVYSIYCTLVYGACDIKTYAIVNRKFGNIIKIGEVLSANENARC